MESYALVSPRRIGQLLTFDGHPKRADVRASFAQDLDDVPRGTRAGTCEQELGRAEAGGRPAAARLWRGIDVNRQATMRALGHEHIVGHVPRNSDVSHVVGAWSGRSRGQNRAREGVAT